MTGKIDSFGLSDIGRVRSANEDQFLIADLNRSMFIRQTSLDDEDPGRLVGPAQGQLLLVADGMGGHAAGKRASTLAVRSLAESMLNTVSGCPSQRENHEDALERDLQAAVQRCQREIQACSEAHSECRGMGTTLTMAYILWPHLYVVHAGDSRCYRLRHGQLEQITTDHTLVQQLIDRGTLSPAQAKEARFGHVLWNCLGGGKGERKAEVSKSTLAPGDTLLLCTDGLTTCIPDDKIRTLLAQGGRAQESCRQLVTMANEAGGPDNITVIVARVGETKPDSLHARYAAVMTEKHVASDPTPTPIVLEWPAPMPASHDQTMNRTPGRPVGCRR